MSEDKQDRVWDIATKLAVPAVIALAAMIFGHELRLTRIESSRYTTEDALHREREVNAKFDSVQRELGLIRTDLAVVREILEKKVDE